MRRPDLALCLAAFAVVGGACDEDLPFEPRFSAIQTEVFDRSCVFFSCHSTVGRKGDLVLEADVAYANLVGAPADNGAAAAMGLVRVSPGDPDQSFLVIKLTPPVDATFGVLMPEGSGGLTPESKVDAIAEWILAGAQDD